MRHRSNCAIKKNPSTVKFEPFNFCNDKIDEVLLENDKLKKDKKLMKRQSLKMKDLPELVLKKPIFNDIKKDYPIKDAKPLFIHEKAQLIENFDKSQIEEIEEYVQIIKFDKLLFQFKNEEEIGNLELQDLIDIDFEKLEEIKYKIEEFIDACGSLIEEKSEQDNHNESNLLVFFSDKLEELIKNKINIQIFVNNLDRVRGISYSNNGVKVYFKNVKK